MDYRARTDRSGNLVIPFIFAMLLSCMAVAGVAATSDGVGIPQYVQLAYVPERETSLLELPAGYWTVQALALSSKEALEAFAQKHQLQGMTAARIAQDGKLLYILLLGVYQTRERAERAIENVPSPFADLSLWIRPLGTLQAAMTDANNLSGNDAF